MPLVRGMCCTNWTAITFYIIDLFYFLYTYLLHYYLARQMRPMSGKEENVKMEDVDSEQMMEHCDEQLDDFGDLPGASDATLGNFFRRPVKIYSTDWLPTANIYTSINPWELFFTNPRVENRLTNFKLLRANLKLKVVINGNSFYQGRLMVSYNPLSFTDEYFTNTSSFGDHIRLYQRQKLLCDPCQSTGGEMELPFIWHNDYLDVIDIATETEEMGSLTLRTLSALRLSTEALATTPVTVTIFAWAEDVVVGGLTDTDLNGMSPQGGPEDEYVGGPISKAMATVRSVVSPLTALPYIGSYARATEIASGAIGSIAKIFGFSRPTNIEEPTRMQPRPTYSLATTEGNDGSLKLTLDPKQEVTIDPKLWNCDGKDCLAVNAIAGVDSLYTSFLWNGTVEPDTRLFSTLVDPCVNHVDTNSYLPACCGVTLPFDYWTGSLEFTFEIVASAFHRGRIAVIYDPHQTPFQYESNTAYQQVIDISEQRKFSVRVGPSQVQALRKHYLPGQSDAFFPSAEGGHSTLVPITSTMISNAGDIGNGTLSVYVINKLVALNSATVPTVDILVSVKACDDFRVFVPNNELVHYSYLRAQAVNPQSAEMRPMGGFEPLPDGVLDKWPTYNVSVKGSLSDAPNIYVGEQVLSIRSLLKRYTPYLTDTVEPDGYLTGNLIRMSHALYPLMYLYADQAVHRSFGSFTDNINYVGHSYISYFRAAFAVLRGSTRWKYVPLTPSQAELNAQLSVNRSAGVSYTPPTQVVLTSGTYSMPRSGLVAMQRSMAGQAITVSNVNSALEFEVPFYSNRRFAHGSSGQDTKTCDIADGFDVIGETNALGGVFQTYVAAGEDLTMGYFFGFPPVIYHPTVPAAN